MADQYVSPSFVPYYLLIFMRMIALCCYQVDYMFLVLLYCSMVGDTNCNSFEWLCFDRCGTSNFVFAVLISFFFTHLLSNF